VVRFALAMPLSATDSCARVHVLQIVRCRHRLRQLCVDKPRSATSRRGSDSRRQQEPNPRGTTPTVLPSDDATLSARSSHTAGYSPAEAHDQLLPLKVSPRDGDPSVTVTVAAVMLVEGKHYRLRGPCAARW